MASTLPANKVIRSLEEVPERSSVPLQFRIASAVLTFAGNFYYRKDYTVNRGQFKLIDHKLKARSKPVDGISSEDIVIGEHTDQFVRIFTPVQQQPGSRKLPLMIYFHGGGFCTYGADSKIFDKLCRTLCKGANAVVVSVNYRLASEFRYPTAYDDCWQAFQWIQSDCRSGGLCSKTDPSQVFLMGDSAGGNIAHFMMVRATREREKTLSSLKIKGAVFLSPFFGGEERTAAEIKNPGPDAYLLNRKLSDWFWAAFLPVGSDRNHQACNVFGPNADDISVLYLPPILVMIGSMDILQDWQVRYVNQLREMGKQVETRWSNMCHGEYLFGKMTETVGVTVEFMKSLLS